MLCTTSMVQIGSYIFIFFVRGLTAKYSGGAHGHRHIAYVIQCFTTNMQIKVLNVVLYKSSVPMSTLVVHNVALY